MNCCKLVKGLEVYTIDVVCLGIKVLMFLGVIFKSTGLLNITAELFLLRDRDRLTSSN